MSAPTCRYAVPPIGKLSWVFCRPKQEPPALLLEDVAGDPRPPLFENRSDHTS